MLVLARKEGEKVNIGGEIEITIVEISNGKVRLGITAPREVPVHRHEIFERIHADAARTAATDNLVAATAGPG